MRWLLGCLLDVCYPPRGGVDPFRKQVGIAVLLCLLAAAGVVIWLVTRRPT